MERNAARLTYTLDVAEWPTASSCSCAWARRRPTRATPTCRASGRSSTSCLSSTGIRTRHEVDGAGRHGREGARRARPARPRARRLRRRIPSSSPRARRCATSCSPTGRGRRLRRRATATRSRACTSGRRADRPRRRELGRDDQAGRERVPDDADLVHQRDRERLRGDRRRRRQGGRGHRARPPSRPAFPARRHRLRRLVLPEGLAGAQAARLELGLPLPAAVGGDRGERAAEAAGDRQADSGISGRCAAGRSRCSGWRSSRTRTTCARRRRSCSPHACWPRAPRCVRGTRSPTAATLPRGRRGRRLGARGGARRRRGRDRHRVGRAA